MSDPRPLHRLFGLSWIDFFQGTAVEVETEMDLSLKQQFVDVVLIRRGPGPIPRPLPDGFEDLAGHNLAGRKSGRNSCSASSRAGKAPSDVTRRHRHARLVPSPPRLLRGPRSAVGSPATPALIRRCRGRR
jgi:hypothetical protein